MIRNGMRRQERQGKAREHSVPSHDHTGLLMPHCSWLKVPVLLSLMLFKAFSSAALNRFSLSFSLSPSKPPLLLLEGKGLVVDLNTSTTIHSTRLPSDSTEEEEEEEEEEAGEEDAGGRSIAGRKITSPTVLK